MNKFKVIGAIIGIVLLVGYFCLVNWANEFNYNEGLCFECGGELEFIDVEATRHWTHYYYQCVECDEIVCTSHNLFTK